MSRTPLSLPARRRLTGLAAATVLCAAGLASIPASAAAQGWPGGKPIRLVIGFPPGGSVDILARVLAEDLGKRLDARIVVENKPGAIGTIALNQARAVAPDGYTLLIGTNPQLGNDPSVTQTGYDDLVPVALTSALPVVVLSGLQAPFSDLKGMIDAAKAGRKLSSSSPGAGSVMHMAIEELNRLAGINVLHVPYTGGPAATLDAAGGTVDMVTVGLPTALPFVQSGKLRPLAVMQAQRSPIMPTVPTVEEAAGIHGIDIVVWLGLFAPGGTPASITDPLREAGQAALADPATRERLAAAAIEPRYGDGRALTTLMRAQHDSLRASAARNAPAAKP